MLENQPVAGVVEEQEDPKAAQYRILFRRLYDDAEGEQKFNLTNEKRYLAHAILQIALYLIYQECGISYEFKNCINDGTNAFPMSKESFLALGKNELDILGNDINNPKIKDNPITKEAIKGETFYFYNCHIEAGKFNDSNLHERFFNNEFDSYKTAYNQAKLMILGLIEVDQYLPDEIKNVVSQINLAEKDVLSTIISSVEKTNSIDDIVELENKIKDKLKNLESFDQIKKAFTNAVIGRITKFVEKTNSIDDIVELENKIKDKQSNLESFDQIKKAFTNAVIGRITKFVENAQSAEEINELLKQIVANKKDEPLGKIIKEILNNKEYQDRYKDAQEGFLTKFKNFVIKCCLAIYEFAKWWFTVDLINEARDNLRENCEAATEHSAKEDFKTFVTTKLNEQNVLGVA